MSRESQVRARPSGAGVGASSSSRMAASLLRAALLCAAAPSLTLAGGASVKPWCDPSPSGNYSSPIKGVQCQGMTRGTGATAAACAKFCCANSTCATWLFGTGSPGGCYVSPNKCVGTANPTWAGASKFALPPQPPPPPPPNGVRLLLFATPDCTGAGTPDMTYKLDTCSALEPFPHARHDAGVKITAASCISCSNFSLATWAQSRTCAGAASTSAPVVVDVCAKATHGSPAGGPEGTKWVRAWVPP